MRVFVLGSGSSGNALLVESCGTRVLIEAGIGPRLLAARLAELGVTIAVDAPASAPMLAPVPPAAGVGDAPDRLHGIVATHHHGDHFGQADALARAFHAPLYLHAQLDPPAPKTRRKPEILDSDEPVPSTGMPPSRSSPTSGISASSTPEPLDIRRYDVGRTFRIGELTISTVQVPHDCAQIAIRIDDGRSALGVATDVGRVTPALVGLLSQCDAALVEANHCTEMLAFSEYPDVVKRRVSGGFGHLSNTQTAELAARLVGSRLGRLWLGHLSRSNNTPARALEVVATRARRIDVDVLPSSAPVALRVSSAKPYQLGLPFT